MFVEQDFTPYEAMTPVGIDAKRMTQEGYHPAFGRPTNEDQAALQRGLQIEMPPRRHEVARGTPLVFITARCRLATTYRRERSQTSISDW